MPLRIVLVQGNRLPMPTAEPPQAIGPGKACVGLGFKYGNTGGKLPDKYGNFRKRSIEAEIVFAFSFR